MARKTKYQPNEINAELVLFSNAKRDKYKSDSYACGYYESLLTSIIENLPKKQQEEVLTNIRKSVGLLEAPKG